MKVLVVYYTQTGQMREIVQSVTAPMARDKDIELVFEALRPKPPFPFPWTSDQFFQAMPESVRGIPCELEPLNVKAKDDIDLIILAWQPWYLSPSIPIHAFFQLASARELIKDKPVISLIGCRNMWVMAYERVKQYIRDAHGQLVGNIVLYDKAPNLLSVVSVIRWMFKGKKERFLGFIPPAGVSQADITGAARFGDLIHSALQKKNYTDLQRNLVVNGAADVNTGLVMIEKRGIMLFRIWADFILRKGPYGSGERLLRVKLFKYYLLLVIYLVSPFATLLYELIRPFRLQAIKKQISLYQSN